MTIFQRYSLGVALGFFLGGLALLANVEAAKGKPIENGRWVAESLAIKDGAVSKLNPELVIVSGSNGLFGFSAERLTNKYGLYSVNAAIHAGLGIDYTLHYARRYLKPGRIIVLPLEYEQYTKPSEGDTFVFQAVNYDPSFIDEMSLHEELAFIASIPIGVHLSLLKNSVWPSTPSEGGYNSKTLNEYGDETRNDWSNGERDRKVEALEQSLRRKATKKYEHNNQAWLTIQQFVVDAKKLGSTVVLTHPNRFDQSINLSLNEDFFIELVKRAEGAGVIFVGSPEDRLYDKSRIYDTRYHQNSLGQTISTEVLYNQLKSAGLVQ